MIAIETHHITGRPVLHVLIMMCLIATVASCNWNQESFPKSEIPKHLEQIENLTVISPQEGAKPDTVMMVRDAVFESSDDVFIEGYIGNMAVDMSNRVYISASVPGKVGVYVFEPDGTFIQRFAREGRGPGEYESIVSLQIKDNVVYLFDARLQKIGRFSANDFSHLNDIVLKRDELAPADSLAKLLRGRGLHVVDDSDDILHLRKIAGESSDIQSETFHKISANGTILPGSILTLDRFQFYYPPKSDLLELPVTMPFTRSSLFSVTKNGRLITNWTDDFLIRVHDVSGKMERAFYLPATNNTLDMREFELDRYREKVLAQYDMPDSWPAVHTMELDDQARLWVATITDSDSTFTWHVINLEGEHLAQFELAGDKMSRIVMSKPLHLIKNGYFYSHERDLQQGVDRIVKYRIMFLPVED